MDDQLTDLLLELIDNSPRPLDTKSIEEILKNNVEVKGEGKETIKTITRTKIITRLNDLTRDGKIKSDKVGGGRGTLIWWSVKLQLDETDV
ncbi:MAG: hypothetical protein ACFFCS_00490 [Candidatus Hodarchaeota archaeon]